MLPLLISLALASPGSSAAKAQLAGRHTGLELQAACDAYVRGDPKLASERDIGFCWGLVFGIEQGHNAVVGVRDAEPLFCTPQGFTAGQGAQVVSKFLRDHPEKLHEADVFLVIRALMDAFPCPAKP